MSVAQISIYSRFGDTPVSLCDLCEIIFNGIDGLDCHIGKRHTYRCSKCSFTCNNKNDYVRTRKQWMDHMTIEHEFKNTSVSELVSGRVTQWTFRINLPASNETASPSHLFYYISTMENKEVDIINGTGN